MSSASFHIENVFQLSDGRVVLIGEPVAGRIHPGDTITLPIGGQPLTATIRSVERIDDIAGGIFKTGLLLTRHDGLQKSALDRMRKGACPVSRPAP